MLACGFDRIEEVASATAAIEVATRTRPDAIVVDIELAGSRGVGIVAALLTAVPGCSIIVVSPFDGLRFPALEAGAYACIGKSDLRELRRCLTRLDDPLRGSSRQEGTGANG